MRRDKEQTRIHRINRLLYSELKDEYKEYRSHKHYNDCTEAELKETLRIRRCVIWLSQHDLPIDSAMGLFAHEKKIPKIESALCRWIGDADKCIEHFLSNVGLTLLDEIKDYGERESETQRVILEWKEVDWNGKRRLQCGIVFQNGR